MGLEIGVTFQYFYVQFCLVYVFFAWRFLNIFSICNVCFFVHGGQASPFAFDFLSAPKILKMILMKNGLLVWLVRFSNS